MKLLGVAHLRCALACNINLTTTHLVRRSVMFAIVPKQTVAEKYQFVVGIDTHAKKHVATIVTSLGTVVAQTEMKVTTSSMQQFVSWVMTKVDGDTEAILFAIEGTSSYGETLTRLLLSKGLHVAEVKPPKTKGRGGTGKTDQIDAELAAIGVLRTSVDQLAVPRQGEDRKALRVLLQARRHMVGEQTASKNALIALLRGHDLGIDARSPLTPGDYLTVASWHVASKDTSPVSVMRREAKRLGSHVVSLQKALADNHKELTRILNTLTPGLLDEPGVGAVSLAQVVCSYSHRGRVRSPEAFAALAGTTPIPASSGNTTHYRLNHFGDRQLNHALHTVALCRMKCDDATIAYVEKRTQDGLSHRDIHRSLKRYIARSLYKKLQAYELRP